MNAKLRVVCLIFLSLLFAGVSAEVVFRPDSTLILLTLLNAVILAVLVLDSIPLAFILAVSTMLLSIFFKKKVDHEFFIAIPINLLLAYGAIIYFSIEEKIQGRFRRKIKIEREQIFNRTKNFQKEVSFYEEKHMGLTTRGQQRRRLSQAARELGSLLEPGAIQAKLLDTARTLFEGEPVALSIGDNPDEVDNFVIQKRQSVLLQDGIHKGRPFMAAPISFQRTVSGILRVGGVPRQPYSKEEFRLMEILSSLASMALDNSFLFNQVKDTAMRDGLTGLLTHRALNEQLDSQILEASRYNHPLSLILTDLDHFKSVNDNFGHQTGDQILQGFAHVLVRNIREVDIVARYGGEEFILLLLQTSHEDACRIAEQIRQDLASIKFDVTSNSGQKNELGITGSFGVASFPSDATSGQQLVRMANQRLYQAKNQGRNRVVGR